MRIKMMRNWFVWCFILKTVFYFGGTGVFYASLEKPSPEKQDLNTCERQVLPDYGKDECDAFQEWCSVNVWQQEEDATFIQSFYLWVFQARVNKCEEYSKCMDELAFSFGLGTFVFCVLFLDYLRDYHKVREEMEARREPKEPEQEPEPEPEKHRRIRAAINAELAQVFGSKPRAS